MLSDAERNVLNTALEKYRPGESEPIPVGGRNVLKPALRLMTYYRLVIEEIKDGQAVTSYTRWVDAVQVRGAENQEVYVTFSPRFERILAGIKEASPGVSCQEAGQYWAPKPVCSAALQLGEEVRHDRNQAHFFGTASQSTRARIGTRCGRKFHPKSAFAGLGKPAPESLGDCH
jgi:hypothetical protein